MLQHNFYAQDNDIQCSYYKWIELHYIYIFLIKKNSKLFQCNNNNNNLTFIVEYQCVITSPYFTVYYDYHWYNVDDEIIIDCYVMWLYKT